MNPIGIQYLYWNTTDVDAALELTARSGADVFECGTSVVCGMTPDERKAFGKKVRSHGLALTLNGGVAGSDLCSPDPAVREESIRLSCEAIRASADAGSSIWGGIIYAKWLDIPEKPFTHKAREDMWARGVESLRKVMPVAEQCGVNVCFEIVNRFEAYMITTVADGIRFCQDIGSPNAKLLLDVFHMNIEEDSMEDVMTAAMESSRFGHLHISESNRGLPGLVRTDMDWQLILGTLQKIGYAGVVTMEPMVLMETESSAKYRIWRDMIPQATPEALLSAAQKSIDFVREIGITNTV